MHACMASAKASPSSSHPPTFAGIASFEEGADDILISESALTLDEDDDNDGYTDEEESAEGTDPANADSTPFVPRSRIPFLVPILNSAP